EYPHYTGIPPKTVSAPDGAIEGVTGTRVRITVHCTQPLNERSRITLNPGTPNVQELPLAQAEPGKNDYQAMVTVGASSGTYHFALVNSDGLEGVPDATRTITAHPDLPPTISIVSPHQGTLAVRDDDMVPIKYRASDDFGVAKILVMITVDDKQIPPFQPIWDPTDRRNITGEYDLSVADILKQAGFDAAHHITYQFQAWDNCEPTAHSAMTVKQTLNISKGDIQSYEARLESHDANHLIQAINEAINRLNQADEPIARIAQADPARPLPAGERQMAENAKNLLTKTATDLTDSADDAMSSEMANMAAQAEDIAARPITDAAQSVAKAQLDADAGTQRQHDAAAAAQQVADARKQLQALLEDVKKTEQRSEAAHDLADAAKDQQKAAQDMAQHPDQVAKNQAEQKKADEELAKAMNEDPALKQDQAAQTTADKLAALLKKIDLLHDQQENASQATANQKAPDAAKIASAQKALNDQIAQFEKQQHDNLQSAQTKTPSDAQQDQIVADLNNNQTAPAGDKMQNAVNQLSDTAKKLQQASTTPQPFNSQQQNQLNADQQAQATAQATQTQAEQAATALNQETQQPAAGDATIDQAQQTAKAIGQQAQAMKPQGNDATDSRTNATQQAQKAAADITAAQTAATPADATKDMQQAAQELRHAANALVQAQQQSAAADKQAMQQQQAQSNQQAAAQALTLAQQQ
ncbi:MAG TPA: hypothetical protein VHY57_04020, partial [Rhizomicrobium sp.]|nr:hypothetical protein [Rhizomicrobium sp.]